MEEEWSKREKLDFYRALITYGVPLLKDNDYDWAFLKEKANLKRKSADLIEKYYIEFLKACRGVIQGDDEKKKAAAPNPAPAAAAAGTAAGGSSTVFFFLPPPRCVVSILSSMVQC